MMNNLRANNLNDTQNNVAAMLERAIGFGQQVMSAVAGGRSQSRSLESSNPADAGLPYYEGIHGDLGTPRVLERIRQLREDPKRLSQVAQYVHSGAVAPEMLPDLNKAMENPKPASGNANSVSFPRPDNIMGIPASLFMNLFIPPQVESQKIEAYEYPGFHNIPSHCGVRLEHFGAARVAVHLYHLPNAGTSPVNIIDKGLAANIYRTKLDSVPADNILWKIHTPDGTMIVDMNYDGGRFSDAKYRSDRQTDGALGNFTLAQWNMLQAHQYWINHAGGAVGRALAHALAPVQTA